MLLKDLLEKIVQLIKLYKVIQFINTYNAETSNYLNINSMMIKNSTHNVNGKVIKSEKYYSKIVLIHWI